jgi:hypothetical protein
LAFDGRSLLLAASATAIAVFSVDDGAELFVPDRSDTGPAGLRHPALVVRGLASRIQSVVPLPAAGLGDGAEASVMAAVATQAGMMTLDLEAVDEEAPAPAASVALDRNKDGTATDLVAVSPFTLAASTTLGCVMLWDTRTRFAMAVNRASSAVVALQERGAQQHLTALVQLDAHTVATGSSSGEVCAIDLRCASGNASASASAATWRRCQLPPLLDAATNGRMGSCRQLVACLRRQAAAPPGTVAFSTLSGFVGTLHAPSGVLTGGTFVRDGGDRGLAARFGVSPTSNLIVCPRVDRQTLSLVDLPTMASAAIPFASPILHAAVHPSGECAGGVWGVDLQGCVWHVSPCM